MDESGFVMVPRDVLYDTRLSAHARLMWIVLQSHADAEGRCWPSHERLAELTGLSKPTVRHCLDCLVAAGLLGRERTAHANHYRVQGKESFPCTGKKLSSAPESRGKKVSSEGEQRKDSFLAEEKNLPLQRKEIFPEREPLNETHRTRLRERDVNARSSRSREASAPAELTAFDSRLRGQAGYAPTAQFYVIVSTKYGHLDLVEEAEKMAGWLGTQRARKCSTAFVLNWLKKTAQEAAQPPRAPAHNGQARLPNQRTCTRCGQAYGGPKVEAAAFAGLCADCRNNSARYVEGRYAHLIQR